MLEAALIRTIPVADGLGESILWDDRARQVLWTDMPGRRLHVHDPDSGATTQLSFDEDLCSFGLVENGERLVCAFTSGIALFDRSTGRRRWIYRLPHRQGIRLNDGRVDRQGRFWVGALVEDSADRLPEGVSGELYRVDATGRVTSHLDGIRIANSLCWSPDGKVMYFGDSASREICAFDFDRRRGALDNRRVFVRTPPGSAPDGSTVDSEGFLWNAEWGSGRVVRYAPDGREDAAIQLPVTQVTCVSFGGDELRELYVTSANMGLPKEAHKEQPQAGDVFVFRTSVRGLPEARFVNANSNP